MVIEQALYLPMNTKTTRQPSPIIFICLLALLGYFGLNVIQTMTDGYNYQDRLTALERQVQELSNKKAALKDKLDSVQSQQFIEAEARNKLHLAKANEMVVIFPQT